ncbi:leucyl aminopeptidase family protein [Algoriphagus sp. CAU 1675]|uniref:leucyl aminopeptidase family protein n=1 Tax=Algoriphagus sp. CAU 1675 TaxID=3032597 RepID=UPI0023D9E89E|nr:leucyl aminopeptidase family protein [Algoriphagus sp. CAU 1675]MDF2158260.1 leucyl aminopeptidase family protein [Algoriphagus sp. CAU 1675]
MKFNINPGNHSTEGLRVIPFLENDLKEIQKEKLGEFPIDESLFSAKKDSSYAYSAAGELRLLIGLEKKPDYLDIENAFRRILSKNQHLIKEHLVLDFPKNFPDEYLEAALTGLLLGNYHLDFFKKERKKEFSSLEIDLILPNPIETKLIDRARKIATAKIEAFKLVDLPPNKITPDSLSDWAENLGNKLNIKVQVFDRERAKTENLEAFLAVGRGSSKEPRFIILEYRHPEAKKHIGLVGKGVTFDTGGLNVKTQSMHEMKSDMGGAAAVLAAAQLIADLQLPIHLTTIVPAVENAIDKDAYLPSEVIGSHAGLSIEVIDTDAEGRLILADALSYLVKNYKTDHLIDFATLTGSAIGTFGYECAALFSNNETLSKQLQEAGMEVGEKSWPLPIWESYAREMDSEIADIKNYHGKPMAGAITAAKFLQAFTHDHPSWAHLDIAGVSFRDSEFAKTKSGTAYGVGLLMKFIENQIEHQ